MPVQVKETWEHELIEADFAIINQISLELQTAKKFNGNLAFDPSGGSPIRVFEDQESADAYIAAINTINPPPKTETTTVDSIPLPPK
jgi:hypothetical protein